MTIYRVKPLDHEKPKSVLFIGDYSPEEVSLILRKMYGSYPFDVVSTRKWQANVSGKTGLIIDRPETNRVQISYAQRALRASAIRETRPVVVSTNYANCIPYDIRKLVQVVITKDTRACVTDLMHRDHLAGEWTNLSPKNVCALVSGVTESYRSVAFTREGVYYI